MPQMAPMNWLILYFYFMMSFNLIMNMIYFNFIKKIKNKNKMMKIINNYNKFI